MNEIETVGIVGSGPISAGWAARFLAHGLHVIAQDAKPATEERLRAGVDRAWPALQKLGLMPGATRQRLRFTTDLEELGRTAGFIQVSPPDDEAAGRALFAEIDQVAAPEVVIASSSARLMPDRIQAECRFPGRILVAHPSQPVYLLPLVELLGGAQTDEAAISRALSFYRGVGMQPLRLRRESQGLIADRLQAALWREAQLLAGAEIAAFPEIEEAVAYGPGLCWAILGTCQPWPPDQPAAAAASAALEEVRDDCLIGIMRGLRQHNQASGKIIAMLDAKRYTSYRHSRWQPGAAVAEPLELYACAVDPNWIDYNGHMTESSYLAAFGDASDALFRYVGIDEDYRAQGHSFYTVETHINYYREVGNGEPLHFTTQLLGLDEKRLHLFHTMVHGLTDKLIATTEQMLVHVDASAAAAFPIEADVYEALSAIMAAHREMALPGQVGRQMAITRKS